MENQNKKLMSGDGFLEVLDLLPVSRDFEQRCLEAAEISRQVRNLRKLRKAAQTPVVERKGFRELIEGLAEAAHVDGRRILEWFGIEGPAFLADGRRAARLARGLGLEYRQFLFHVLFETAQMSEEPVQEMLRETAKHQVDLAGGWAVLSGITWDPKTAASIKTFERAAAEEYDAGAA